VAKDTHPRKAEDYVRYRPGYAAEAITALIQLTVLQPNWSIADIGSGPGSVTQHLVSCVQAVFAVEPDAAMRRQAELRLAGFPAFHSIADSAEKTGLNNSSIDMIVIGQALHWFDPVLATREFVRILKPAGWLAAIWNRFDAAPDPEFELYFDAASLRRKSFATSITENWEQFIGGARSTASAPNIGDPDYEEFEKAQREIFTAQAQAGLIEVHYSTELVVGHLRI
jgi:SAM-dependent methyltransferase